MRECLLIDDDPDDLEIFEMCIRKVSKGIHCTTISDAPEAIEMLKSNKEYVPEYIFLDVNMPKMNGVECLKVIKTIDRLSRTKVFMYSTTSSKATVDETKKLGADEFIIKPSKTIELKDKLAKIFSIVSEMEN